MPLFGVGPRGHAYFESLSRLERSEPSGTLGGQPITNALGDVVSDDAESLKAFLTDPYLARWVCEEPVQSRGSPGEERAAFSRRIVDGDDEVPALPQQP